VFRSTRNIVLTLLGSAALLGCCCTSCVDARDEPERDANGNIVTDANGNPVYHHRRYYFHPWFYHGYYGSPFWTHTYSPSYSPGRSVGGSGGARPSSGATSRGGFGSTGHATAGG